MRYPKWWEQTITLYHRTVGAEQRVIWTRSTLKGCFAQVRKSTNYDNDSRRSGGKLMCRIPAPMPTAELGDIVVIGKLTADIDEYTAGQRSSDLLAAHSDAAFTVTELHDNTQDALAMPHLYVGGV